MSFRRVQVFTHNDRKGKVFIVPSSMHELLSTVQNAFSITPSFNKLYTSSGAQVDHVHLIQDNEILYIQETERSSRTTAVPEPFGDDWITLNVGGKIFSTTRTTLVASEQESMFAKMFQYPKKWNHKIDETGAVLFDRSPTYFEPILGYLRHGQLIIDPNLDPRGVLEEAKFYGLPSVVEKVEKLIQKREEGNYHEPLTRCMVINSLLVTPAKCELRFQGINFSGADLSRLDLRYINFKLANLTNCNLSQSNLYCCSLERADLSGSTMDGANLQGVRMICCNAENCSMKGCNFDDPSGLKANMEGANLKGVNLEGSLMAGANLRVATVKNSNLKNCDLRGAILAGTDLENCDLSGCDLFEANLRGCNVKGTKFEEMITPLHMTQAVP